MFEERELIRLNKNEIIEYIPELNMYQSTLIPDDENITIEIYAKIPFYITDLEYIKKLIEDRKPDFAKYDIDESIAVSIYKIPELDMEIEVWEHDE